MIIITIYPPRLTLKALKILDVLTPQARFELATNRLTADRSTTELLRTANIYINCKGRSFARGFAKFFINLFVVNLNRKIFITSLQSHSHLG